MGLEVLRGGAQTTVQDRGRIGFQDLGFSESGVMDRRAFRLANALLDNAPNDAVLEITLIGPKLLFRSDNCFVITGADLGAELNGAGIEMNRVYAAKAGDILSWPKGFPKKPGGLRAYLGLAGGIDVPMLMGSRSTYLRGKLGGFEGRALREGDILEFCAPERSLPNMSARFVREDQESVYGAAEKTVRVVLGPQDDRFTEKGIQTFLNEIYTVTDKSDRMGFRLDGPVLEHVTVADIVSDGIAYGAVQVPREGKPIILLADRQATGGYTKIANVITVDIPKVAQSRPGAKIRFVQVSVEEAQTLILEEEAWFEALEAQFVLPADPGYKYEQARYWDHAVIIKNLFGF